MEQLHTARRSASHGALNQSYRAHGSHTPRVASSPFSRPLRSVNENTILPSPGPLESMLKTTTETGDIGLFSIKPVSSSTIGAGTIKPRQGLGHRTFARSLNAENADTVSLHDDRRRLPSYRDTTSEILSMYGSESQRSASSTLSRAFDDLGPRSYSMTSCSSRPLPNQKSSGTLQSLQSQSSAGPLQRPRSPFPYPTRLKRVGVRPSSPALTENGSVDYSKMVEIDRVPSRTVHGSYKPSYGRPLPPLFPRPEIPRSPMMFGPGAGAYPACRPSSSSSQGIWGSGTQPRIVSRASEQSHRTASLTSIVDMYQNTSGTGGSQRGLISQPANSFYYDYSEGFDIGPDRPLPPSSPLAPVPTRAPSMHRPKVLDDDCQSHMGFGRESCDNTLTTLHETSSIDSSATVNRAESKIAMRHNIHASEAPDEKFVGPPTVPCSARLCQSHDVGRASTTTQEPHEKLPETVWGMRQSGGVRHLTQNQSADLLGSVEASVSTHDIEPAKPNISWGQIRPRSRQDHRHLTENLNSDSQDSTIVQGTHEARPLSKSPAIAPRESHLPVPSDARRQSTSSTSSHCLRRSKFFSIEPGLSDLASLVNHLDRAGNTSQITDEDVSPLKASTSESKRESRFRPKQQHTLLPSDHFRVGMDGASSMAPGYESCSNSAPEPVNQIEPSPDPDTLETTMSRSSSQDLEFIDRSKTPMLAPKPISPARELRVKNSIPQLMKALPPLPNSNGATGDLMAPEGESSRGECDTQTRLPTLALSNQSTPVSSSAPSAVGSGQNPIYQEAGSEDRRMESCLEQNTTTHLKRRLKNSTSLESVSSHRLRRANADMDINVQRDNELFLEPIEERVRNRDCKNNLGKQRSEKSPSKAHGSHGVSMDQDGAQGSGSLSSVSPRQAIKAFSPRKVRKSFINSAGTQPEWAWREDGSLKTEEQDVSSPSAPTDAQVPISKTQMCHEMLTYNSDTVVRTKPRRHFVETESYGPEGISNIPKPVRAMRKPLSNLLIRPDEFSGHDVREISRLSHRRTTSHNLGAIGVATAVTPTSSLLDTSDNPDLSKSVETMGSPDGAMSMTHRGLRKRLSRWFKTAKHAIGHACHKRRSSSYSS